VRSPRQDGRLCYPERGRRKSPPSADDNRTTGSDDGHKSDQLTVTRVLEPAAQAFADATADPPCLFELGLVEGYGSSKQATTRPPRRTSR